MLGNLHALFHACFNHSMQESCDTHGANGLPDQSFETELVGGRLPPAEWGASVAQTGCVGHVASGCVSLLAVANWTKNNQIVQRLLLGKMLFAHY